MGLLANSLLDLFLTQHLIPAVTAPTSSQHLRSEIFIEMFRFSPESAAWAHLPLSMFPFSEAHHVSAVPTELNSDSMAWHSESSWHMPTLFPMLTCYSYILFIHVCSFINVVNMPSALSGPWEKMESVVPAPWTAWAGSGETPWLNVHSQEQSTAWNCDHVWRGAQPKEGSGMSSLQK